MSSRHTEEYQWLHTGEEAIGEMLAAIEKAEQSVRLEMYIFHSGPTADEFRDALIAACKRGARVRVLLDALGSAYLADSFWQTFRDVGGEIRWFNPISLHRVFIRDHRKVLVCDEEIAFVGGFNIATEYRGDGVSQGWRDLGLKVRGPLTLELAAAFDDMFSCADFKHKPFTRLRKSNRIKSVLLPEAKLLLAGPGRHNPLKQAFRNDLTAAQDVMIVTPYFVPSLRVRRLLMKQARLGAKVRLILPSKCDLPVIRMAAQSFYRRLLKAGVEIYEYQPQILHAKLFVIDDVAYAGSANVDARSMNINYELMVRLTNPTLVEEARKIFAGILSHSKRIELTDWRRSRTFFDRLKGRVAQFLFARLDSIFAQRQLRWWKLSLNKVKQAKKHKVAGRHA